MKKENTPISPIQQASWASVWAYLGIAVGAINFILLLPRVLSIEEVGLVRLIAAGALIYVKLAFVGLDTSAVRFLTGLDRRSEEYASQWRLLFLLSFAGMCLASLVSIAILLNNQEQLTWANFNSGLSIGLILLLFIATLWQRFGESIAQVAGQTAQAGMWRDFAPRIAVSLGAIGIAIQAWNFGGLLSVWSGTYLVGAIWLNISAARQRLHAPILGRLPKLDKVRETLQFASYSFLGTAAATVQTTLDSVMLASLANLSQLGQYAPFAYAASIIRIPERALVAACYPRFRKYLRNNDFESAHKLYQDVALLQLTVGGIILLLLWINTPILLTLLDNPEYSAGAPVLLILGCAFWLHAALGQPNQILLSGTHYRMQGIINAGSLPVGIALNVAMIPSMGAIGAAYATAITLTGIALIKTWLVWKHYSMLPFSKPYPIVAVLVSALLITTTLFPEPTHSAILPQCLMRSLIVCIIIVLFGIKLQLPQKFRTTLQRLKLQD